MSIFVNNNVASGNIVYAADHNTQGALLAAVLNGGIETVNLADSAASTAKIADSAVTGAKTNFAGSDVTMYVPASSTWTYASATTFTAPAGDVALMSVGTRLKLSQTTVKYFYVTGISGTTVTISGGTDYTLANAAITSPYLSNASTPPGFPKSFSYTPTFTNVTTGSGTISGKFTMIGGKVFYSARFLFGAGSSIGGVVSVSLPVTSISYTTGYTKILGQVSMYDTSATTQFTGIAAWASTTTIEPDCQTVATYTKGSAITSTTPMVWATGDVLDVEGDYTSA